MKDNIVKFKDSDLTAGESKKDNRVKFKDSDLFGWLIAILVAIAMIAILGGLFYGIVSVADKLASDTSTSDSKDTIHYEVQAENFSVSFKELNDDFMYDERTCVVYYRNSVYGGRVLVPYLDIDGIPFYYDKDTDMVKKLDAK